MEITERNGTGVYVGLVTAKALYINAEEELARPLRDFIAIEPQRPLKIVIDLSYCASMSSDAIGCLLFCKHLVSTTGGSMRLTGVGANMVTQLRLVGVLDQFAIYPTLDQAMESFQGARS